MVGAYHRGDPRRAAPPQQNRLSRQLMGGTSRVRKLPRTGKRYPQGLYTLRRPGKLPGDFSLEQRRQLSHIVYQGKEGSQPPHLFPGNIPGEAFLNRFCRPFPQQIPHHASCIHTVGPNRQPISLGKGLANHGSAKHFRRIESIFVF